VREQFVKSSSPPLRTLPHVDQGDDRQESEHTAQVQDLHRSMDGAWPFRTSGHSSWPLARSRRRPIPGPLGHAARGSPVHVQAGSGPSALTSPEVLGPRRRLARLALRPLTSGNGRSALAHATVLPSCLWHPTRVPGTPDSSVIGLELHLQAPAVGLLHTATPARARSSWPVRGLAARHGCENRSEHFFHAGLCLPILLRPTPFRLSCGAPVPPRPVPPNRDPGLP